MQSPKKLMFKCLLIACWLLATDSLFAQSNPIEEPSLPQVQIAPPTPEAASLGKYGQIPVSNYTGIPNISIPIHTVQGRNLSVPISISYHAGGIKVEENASRVGLGWSISAGGIITRNKRGYKDEATAGHYGYLNTPFKPSDVERLFFDTSGDEEIASQRGLLLGQIAEQIIDLEPDFFSFSTVGNSGKFFFHEDGRILPVPLQDVKIELSQTFGDDISQWIITHTDGTKFYFGKSRDGYTAVDKTLAVLGGQSLTNPDPYITSWHLTDIISADGRDSISFAYTYFPIEYHNSTTEQRSWNTGYGSEENCAGEGKFRRMEYSTQQSETVRVTSITSINDSVVFNYAIDRLDLPGDKQLTSIDIYQRKGSLIKSVRLHQSYFESDDSFTDDTLPLHGGVLIDNPNDQLCKRLRLDAVQEVGSDGTSKPPHTFAYNTTVNLPHRFSNSIDYWGYYNGRDNSDKGFIPKTYFVTKGLKIKYEQGADRQSDPQYARANMLEKITYPTGGTSTFTFEGNEIEFDEGYSQQLIPSSLTQNTVTINNTSDVDDATNSIYRDTLCITNLFGVLEYTLTLKPGCSNFRAISSECGGSVFHASLKDMQGGLVDLLDGPGQGGGNIFKGTLSYELPDGKYVLEVQVTDGDVLDAESSVSVFWEEIYYDITTDKDLDGAVEMPAGGLRIKKMVHEDKHNPAANQVSHYKYGKKDGQFVSWMSYPPIYVYYPATNRVCQCPALRWVSQSAYPMATAHGSYVYYPDVEILYGDQGSNGKSEFEYSFHRNYDFQIEFLPIPSTIDFILIQGLAVPQIDTYDPGLTNNIFTPPTEVDWRRGNLVKQRDYDAAGKLIKTVNNRYRWVSSTTDNTKWVTAFHQVKNPSGICSAQYYNMTESYFMYQSEETIYSSDENIPPLKTITKYDYEQLDKHQFPTRIAMVESDGDTMILEQKYAPEFWREKWPSLEMTDFHFENLINDTNLSEEEKSWNFMLKENIIQTPLEQKSWYIPNGQTDRYLKSSQKTTFNIFNRDLAAEKRGFLAPKLVEVAELSNPVKEGDLSNLNSLYVPKLQYLGYDPLANLVSFSKDQDVPSSFIWGYEGRYPIAKVVQADASEVAYSGFESSSTGNWIFDYTGPLTPGAEQDCGQALETCLADVGDDLIKYQACYDAHEECQYENSQIPEPTLPALQFESLDVHTGQRAWNTSDGSYDLIKPLILDGTYYVSLWAKGTGGSISVNGTSQSTSAQWQLYEWEVPISAVPGAITIDFSSNLLIDDVRLHPQKAQMSTYNYIPLRGVSSMSDPNHLNSFYEYDDLGRLKLIRDSDGNILQHYDYQYKSN